MNLVYVLHFHEKLHHAQHYIGATTDDQLEKRLRRHAAGHASKITSKLRRMGIEWSLAGLYTTSMPVRIAEVRAKLRHAGAAHCQTCSEQAKKITGCQMVDVRNVKCPITSTELRRTI